MRSRFPAAYGRHLFFFLCGLLAGPVALAQSEAPVQLLGADRLEGSVINGRSQRKLVGNVSFQQNNTLMYCDSALFDDARNFVEAFGHVRIQQGDSVTLISDRALYNGNTRQAKATGNVTLRDPSMTLTTSEVDFDLNKNLAYYYNDGTIVDRENTLTSRQGYYDTKARQFFFKTNVKLVNPQYTLTSDTLQYNALSKVAYFKGPTKIVGKEGTLLANDGEYNTVRQTSVFRGRAKVEYDRYTLSGDSLYYDRPNQIGIARRNVVLVSKEDNTIIEGDYGRYYGKEGLSRVYGHALLRSIADQDTLFLASDTLISYDPPRNKPARRVLAYHNVRIYKSDLQGRCDSLAYRLGDSTLHFYTDPVLWSGTNQLTGDSVWVQLANRKIREMHLRGRAFAISEDTLRNYNQIKGRTMLAQFDTTGHLARVNVDGNGESLYFALNDAQTDFIGMNRVECSRMVIRFAKQKVSKITFITKPDGLFVPPHELEAPDRRLKGFRWRGEEKPLKVNLLRPATAALKP